jgi:hypothetical protein
MNYHYYYEQSSNFKYSCNALFLFFNIFHVQLHIFALYDNIKHNTDNKIAELFIP